MKCMRMLPIMLMTSCAHIEDGRVSQHHQDFDVPVKLSLKQNSSFTPATAADGYNQYDVWTNAATVHMPNVEVIFDYIVTDDFRPGSRDVTLLDDWQRE